MTATIAPNVRGMGTPGRHTGYSMFGAARCVSRGICFGVLAAMLLLPVLGQQASGADSAGHRMQGGGINYAPQPAVYTVIAIDSNALTIQLRAEDGRTGLVHVAGGVYDLSKLKPGDRIRVDFLVPNAAKSQLSAASIWPE